jgi:methionine aminotransferase
METEARGIVSKLPSVGTSIFAVMTRLSDDRGAINLSQGFPDFDCDPELVSLVSASMREGHNQYAPMTGLLALRQEISDKIARLYGHRYDVDAEITVTSGATEAIFSTITAFVRPGDEVLVFEPCYDSYVPAIELSGGTPVFATLRSPDYAVDWDEVRRKVSRRTRMVLLNSPHNPTGMVLSTDDLHELARILDHTDAVVISDEVYEHIVFDGRRHQSLSTHPDLAARACVISSFGKTFHTTGWKIGYVSAPEPLTAEIRKVHQFVTFDTNTPIQHAYARFMRRGADYDALAAFYQEKRDRFLALIEGSRFKPLPCQGTYFQLLDYSAIGTEPDDVFAVRLLEKHGVASIPTSAFLYRSEAPAVLRFCFAKRDETLQQAADRLRRV